MNMITNHMPTAELQALDAAHHFHPFTASHELAEKGARVITGAKGVHLRDSDGNEIMDCMAGLWCVNIGYGHDSIAEVARRQMLELPYYNTFFQTTHVPAIALAQKVAELTPGPLNHVFFASGGSDANDTNIRLVRHYWALKGKPTKQVIISRKNAYHGSTVGAASLGGMQAMHGQGTLPIPGIVHINQPHWYSEGGDMTPEEFGIARARELEEKIAELGEDNVAAFIAEPIQGAGGVIIPPSTYWPEIQRICDEHEVLLIADEVICGFGRTGNWFGSETFGIRPDIMTLAKGLSSGYAPIGASVVTDEVHDVMGQDEFYHGYTYSGHPVACAVALENLRIMEEDKLVDTARDVTAPYLAQKWKQLADHPLVGEARICGMVGALQLTPDKSKRAAFAEGPGKVGLIAREHCFADNFIMRHVGDQLIISPPLIFDKGNVDTLAEKAWKVLDKTMQDASEAGLMKAA